MMFSNVLESIILARCCPDVLIIVHFKEIASRFEGGSLVMRYQFFPTRLFAAFLVPNFSRNSLTRKLSILCEEENRRKYVLPL